MGRYMALADHNIEFTGLVRVTAEFGGTATPDIQSFLQA
jgi:hypothetical protein